MKNAVDYELEFDSEREGGRKVGRGLGGHSTSSRRHPPCSAAVGRNSGSGRCRDSALAQAKETQGCTRAFSNS
jgi:hypothetical protein